MSASLLVIVPVALFVLVSWLCFVGCALDSQGQEPPLGPPPSTYSDTDVLGNPSVVAYWPLSESSATADKPVDSAIAVDTAGTKNGDPHNGFYTNKGNAPDLFPCPGFQVSAGIDSAEAVGTQTLGVTGIVLGDALQPLNDPNVLTTAMQVDGAFVTVPFTKFVNPDTFTVEAWLRPEWDATAPPAFRVFIDSRDASGTDVNGFALWVNEDNRWEAQIGVGADGVFLVTAGVAALSATTHVVLTFDGASATLFINGTPASMVTPVPVGTKFAPNTAFPLVIGVGGPWLPQRMNSIGDLFFPLFPFNGTIQDVAIYNSALDASVVATHFNHGNAKEDPAG